QQGASRQCRRRSPTSSGVGRQRSVARAERSARRILDGDRPRTQRSGKSGWDEPPYFLGTGIQSDDPQSQNTGQRGSYFGRTTTRGQSGEAGDWTAEFEGDERDAIQLLSSGTAKFQSQRP